MLSRTSKNRLAIGIVVQRSTSPVAQTIRSIREIADELCVVDATLDGLKTLELSGDTPAVYRGRWDDDDGALRNQILNHSQSNWLLWLEPNESLSRADASALRTFINSEAEANSAYQLLIRRSTRDRDAGEQCYQLRLAPRSPGLKFVGRIRESMQHSLVSHNIQIVTLPITVHSHLLLSRDDQQAQAKRDLKLAQLEIDQEGPQPRLLNAIALANYQLGRVDSAIEYYRLAMISSRRGGTPMLEAYYGLLALARSASDLPAQIDLNRQALKEFPLDTQLLISLGQRLRSAGRGEEADHAIKLAARNGTIHKQHWHRSDLAKYVRRAQIGQCIDSPVDSVDAPTIIDRLLDGDAQASQPNQAGNQLPHVDFGSLARSGGIHRPSYPL